MNALAVAIVLLLLAPIVAGAATDPSPAPTAASAAPSGSLGPTTITPGQPAPTPFTSAANPSEPPDFVRMRTQMEAQMQRISAQLRGSQIALRHRVLALLTPVQRALVATVIGDLAIAPDPDVAAEARRIDSALSPAQQRAVLDTISAEALQREKLFATMVEQTQTITSRFVGGGQPPSPPTSPASPASPTAPGAPPLSETVNSMPIESGTAFALPGPAMAREMAPNETAGAALIGLLVSPSWMGVAPAPAMIRRVGPAARGEGPPR